MDALLSGGGFDFAAAAGFASSQQNGFLPAHEAERVVESLREFTIEDVGSPAWSSQRQSLERLNVQAHHNAVTNSDEFVKEFLVSHDKVATLVHELLVIEAWKANVFSRFPEDALEASTTNMNAYLACYFEATLVNLLEIAFYHQDACEAAGDDALLELTDYCARALVYLNAGAKKDAEDAMRKKTAKELVNQTAAEELREKVRDARFATACCALTVLRYLTDYVNQVPLCVMARLLDAHDAPMLLVPLLEERPWLRRRFEDGMERPVAEVFSDGAWGEQAREDRMQLTKCDGQVWLALNNLTVDSKCRAKYRYDDHRKATLERVKRFFNDVLFDQLPILKDLQRVVDEVLLMVTPSSHEVTQGRLILEVVPETREALLNKTEDEWKAIASGHLATHFADTPESRTAAAMKMDDMAAMFEFMCEMDDAKKATAKAARKPEPPPPKGIVRVDFSRLSPDDGEYYRWHVYDMEFDPRGDAKEVEVKLTDGNVARGDQYKLSPPAPTTPAPGKTERARAAQTAAAAASERTPVPHDGKVAATYGATRAEATLDLPAPGRPHADVYGAGGSGVDGAASDAIRELSDMPNGVWVTIGQLSRDGFALQLKLKKTKGVHEAYRCGKSGKYYVYEPSGGAITVLRKEKK